MEQTSQQMTIGICCGKKYEDNCTWYTTLYEGSACLSLRFLRTYNAYQAYLVKLVTRLYEYEV